MRIERLDLTAYGPFTDEQIDLSAHGVHLIVGPNEAGKSTTLAAISDALFGIPMRTRAAFVHHMTRLELGMVVSDGRGATLEFRRLKKNKDSLRRPDGSPVADAELARFVGSADRATFASMFGIDHPQLLKGGNDLMAGQGELGELLFGASTGSANLHEVLETLEAKAAGLFKPTGQNPAINASITRFKSAEKDSRDLAVKPKAYTDLVAQIERLQRTVDTNRAASDDRARQIELRRLLMAVLPNLRIRRVARTTLDQLACAPRLRAGLIDDLDHLHHELEQCDSQASAVGREITRLQGDIEQIDLPSALLARAAEVGRWRERRGQYCSARDDRPAVAAAESSLRLEVEQLAARLLPGRDLSDARRALTLPTIVVTRLHELHDQFAQLEASVASAQSQLSTNSVKLIEARASVASIPEPADAGELQRAVNAATTSGDLTRQRAALTAEVESLETDCGQRLRALGLACSLTRVEHSEVPSLSTVQAHVRTQADLELATCASVAAREDTRAQLDSLSAALAVLHIAQVPCEADLAESRIQRDRAWQAIRASWLGATPTIEPADHASGVDSAHDLTEQPVDALANLYERGVAEADATADRLYHDAEQVARRAQLEHTLAQTRGVAHEIDLTLAALHHDSDRSAAEWIALWAPVGVAPGPPESMVGWLNEHSRLLTDAHRWQALVHALSDLDNTIAGQVDALSATLVSVGEPLDRSGQSGRRELSELLACATALIATLNRDEADRQVLVVEVNRLAVDRGELTRSVDKREAVMAQWRDQWATAVAAIGLDRDVSPKVALGFVTDAAALLVKLNETESKQERVRAIDSFIQSFESEIRDLALDIAPELIGNEACATLDVIVARVDRAVADRQRAETLTAELTQRQAERHQVGDHHSEIARRLKALLGEAQVDSEPALRDVARQSDQRCHADLERQRIEAEVRDQSGGRSTDELEALIGDADETELQDQIRTFEGELARINADLDQANIEVGQLRNEVSKMRGSAAAADAAVDAQLALAGLRKDVEEYLGAQLAALLLRDEIARFREERQAPLLNRARPWFARLTQGAFVSLETDLNQRGQVVLEAVRADGERVGVAAMSDGTRDQLYLALRFAAVALAADQRQGLPLVLDDLFINFDDQRTKAALQIVGELSASMQVLVFTHHVHLESLAAQVLGSHELTVHHLTPRHQRLRAATPFDSRDDETYSPATHPNRGDEAVRLRPVS